jgi:AhpD family alkylhydroperoxidase
MTSRLDYQKAAPDAVRTIFAMQAYVNACGLEHPLLELVKIRSSLINGCAYCLDMHTKDARAAGETEQRTHLLSVWREVSLYSPREQAALEWTEAVTEIGRAGVPDDVYKRAREQFSDKELVDLTMAVVTINGWNRLAITFRPEVGGYKSPKTPPKAG